MGIYTIKPAFRRSLLGTRDALIRMGVTADALTWMALLMSSIAGAAIAWSERWPNLLFLVPPLPLFRIALNALDGMVASQTGTARPAGEFFNEMADRIADCAFFIGIAAVVEPVTALLALIVALVSSFAGVLSKATGAQRNYSGVFGKADRMIAISLAAIAAYFLGLIWLAYFSRAAIALGLITLAQRIARSMKELSTDAP